MFVIDENNSISWTDGKQFDGLLFGNLEGLEQIAEARKWSKQTVTDTWNGFAGTAGPFADLKPMKCFKNRPYGLRKIWDAIQRLVPSELRVPGWPRDAASEPAAPLMTESEPDERYPGDTLEDMPKKKAKKKAKKAPKEKRVGFIPETKPGSNLNELIKMIGRKQGASIEEVMARTGWTSQHTVRGRISILGSKGVPIESFKHETRGRVYRTA